VDVERVVVTTGSSGGFLLVFHACFDAGDTVGVGTTCYPCYRNILQAMGVATASIPLNGDFKVTALELGREVARRKAAGLPKLKGLIQSSPANPTGAMLTPKEVQDLCALCEQEGIWYISDEVRPYCTTLEYPGSGDTHTTLSSDRIRATHARPLHPAALAFVPSGIVLVRERR
jgi:aspartate/methionine/tyrosine aminotransferase